MINGCSISPQPAEEEKEESPDTCTMTMEDYFRQEDAKNSVGNSILQKNTLPENQPPLRYPKRSFLFDTLEPLDTIEEKPEMDSTSPCPDVSTREPKYSPRMGFFRYFAEQVYKARISSRRSHSPSARVCTCHEGAISV